MKKVIYLLLFCSTILACIAKKPKNKKPKETESTIKEKKDYSDPTNTLNGKVETLDVNYTIWGCPCPQWITSKDSKAFDENNYDTTKRFYDHHFFLESANDSLLLPIYFSPGRHSLRIEGQFYEKQDYPKGTTDIEGLSKAKVFRYTKMQVIDKYDFKPDSKIETLYLSYNAISCTCAQWSETNNKTDSTVYYWLEPANAKLIDADTIFNGENLPIQIKVTGQIIDENGFPKRELNKVSRDAEGKVFRYYKIEVLKK